MTQSLLYHEPFLQKGRKVIWSGARFSFKNEVYNQHAFSWTDIK